MVCDDSGEMNVASRCHYTLVCVRKSRLEVVYAEAGTFATRVNASYKFSVIETETSD